MEITPEQLAEYELRASMAERKRCAAAIEAMRSPESGPDYGIATDEERRTARDRNNVLAEAAKRIGANL
jgi:hypothetical protein